jgi:hypothetical protein
MQNACGVAGKRPAIEMRRLGVGAASEFVFRVAANGNSRG